MKKRFFNCPVCSVKVDTEEDGGNSWGWAPFSPCGGSPFPASRAVCATCADDYQRLYLGAGGREERDDQAIPAR